MEEEDGMEEGVEEEDKEAGFEVKEEEKAEDWEEEEQKTAGKCHKDMFSYTVQGGTRWLASMLAKENPQTNR